MTPCHLCGVGSDDDCTDGCPSRYMQDEPTGKKLLQPPPRSTSVLPMTFRPPVDPVAAMERLYESMNACESAIADYEARGWMHSARAERKRLAGLRSAKTRLIRTYFS